VVEIYLILHKKSLKNHIFLQNRRKPGAMLTMCVMCARRCVVFSNKVCYSLIDNKFITAVHTCMCVLQIVLISLYCKLISLRGLLC